MPPNKISNAENNNNTNSKSKQPPAKKQTNDAAFNKTNGSHVVNKTEIKPTAPIRASIKVNSVQPQPCNKAPLPSAKAGAQPQRPPRGPPAVVKPQPPPPPEREPTKVDIPRSAVAPAETPICAVRECSVASRERSAEKARTQIEISCQPAKLLGDCTWDPNYVNRPWLEDAVRRRIAELAQISDSAILLVYGEGGVGKTSLVRRSIDAMFLGKCGFVIRAWLNVYQPQTEFDQEKFYADLADAFAINVAQGDVPKQALQRYLRTLNGSKVLIVLDDVCSGKVFECVKAFGDNIRTVCVARRNFSQELGTFGWLSGPAIFVDKMKPDILMKIFQENEKNVQPDTISKLINLCNGLPLLAQVLRTRLQNPEKVEGYLKKLEQIFPLLVPSQQFSDDKKEATIYKTLLLGFEDEAVEFRQRYYGLLFFGECSSIDIDDIAVVWQCTPDEASKFCNQLVDLSMAQSDTQNNRYSLLSYFYEAALYFARNSEKDAKLSKDLGKFESDRDGALGQLIRNVLVAFTNVVAGKSFLHLAIERKRKKVVELILNWTTKHPDSTLLLELCSQKTATSLGAQLPLHLLLESEWLERENTPTEQNLGLDLACTFVEQLLKANRPSTLKLISSIQNSSGKTVLHLLMKSVKSGLKWTRCPLFVAAAKDNVHLIETLADLQANFGVLDDEGNNSLIMASRFGSIKVITAVLSEQIAIDVNACNKAGKTALMMAAIYGREESCRALLCWDTIRVNMKDHEGNTALMHAAKNGRVTVIKELLQSEADISLRNGSDNSALWEAVVENQVKAVKLLCENGARLRSDEELLLKTQARFRKFGEMEQLVGLFHGFTPTSYNKKFDYREIHDVLVKSINLDMSPERQPPNSYLSSIYQGDAKTATSERQKFSDVHLKLDDYALFITAYFGHIDIARFLLASAKVDPNISNRDKVTALMFAAYHGHSSIVQALLERGADVNAKNKNGVTALMLASENGHHDIVNALILKGADVNAERTDDGMTPLMLAAHNGHRNVAGTLIDKGANVDVRNLEGKTPLTIAAENGHEPVVRMLIDEKAAVNVKDYDDWTPLMAAAENGHDVVTKRLIDKGAIVNAMSKDGIMALMLASEGGHDKVVSILIANKADVNAKNKRGWTSLMSAAQNGHVAVVKILIDNKADVNVKDENEWTSLMSASQNGHHLVAKLLVENKTDVNAKDKRGWTALMSASQNGHVEIVKLLIDNKASVNAKTNDGSTALMTASQNGHAAVVVGLIENKAEVNSCNNDGRTSLMKAAENGREAAVRLLIENKADVNAKDMDGWTALMWASKNGHTVVVKILIAAKSDVNAKNSDGRSSLMVASKSGYEPIVQLLVDNKADVNAKDNEGKTALSLASRYGKMGTCLILVHNKADVRYANGKLKFEEPSVCCSIS